MHHAALPYQNLPKFIADLHMGESLGRLVLEVLILMAVRCGDLRSMAWGELDLVANVWAVPVTDGRGMS